MHLSVFFCFFVLHFAEYLVLLGIFLIFLLEVYVLLKNVWMCEIWEQSWGEEAWDPRFMRPFHNWEMVAVQNFIRCIINSQATPSEKDWLVWKVDKTGSFIVKSFYGHLEEESS